MDHLFYQSILRTIAFFDIFDHPLTDRELYTYLYSPPSGHRLDFATFVLRTRGLVAGTPHVRCTNGLWHLVGRQDIIHTRTEHSTSFAEKRRVIDKAVLLFRNIPFIRAVFICNTVAFGTADQDSDIDVLIIVRAGHMWTARLLTIIVFSLFRLRISGAHTANRICLSFYLADRSLNISKLRIPDDIYLSYWVRTLIPMYDPDQLERSIIRANTELLSYFPHGNERIPPRILTKQDLHAVHSKMIRIIEVFFSRKVGKKIEQFARKIQRVRLMKNFLKHIKASDTRVVVSDSVLKFHENDRRALYRGMWKKRLKDLGI